MKEGISNIWLIGIIIVFILIFAAYIAVTISYTETFKLKNTALTIIEKHKGMTSNTGSSGTSKINGESITTNVGAIQTINLYLKGNAYQSRGYCPESEAIVGSQTLKWAGVKELDWHQDASSIVDAPARDNEKYYYCFARISNERLSNYETVYYRVRFFYKMEFPALSEFLAVKVDGMTDEIYDPQDEGLWDAVNNNTLYLGGQVYKTS